MKVVGFHCATDASEVASCEDMSAVGVVLGVEVERQPESMNTQPIMHHFVKRVALVGIAAAGTLKSCILHQSSTHIEREKNGARQTESSEIVGPLKVQRVATSLIWADLIFAVWQVVAAFLAGAWSLKLGFQFARIGQH